MNILGIMKIIYVISFMNILNNMNTMNIMKIMDIFVAILALVYRFMDNAIPTRPSRSMLFQQIKTYFIPIPGMYIFELNHGDH